MLDRRTFLSTALAGTAAAALPGAASALPRQFQPRMVRTGSQVPAGELHLDPNAYALYWGTGDGLAIRYAVGVARRDLWSPGVFRVGAKKVWPSWTPTPNMIRREPEIYAQWAGGMEGGPNNPLGARALYLFRGGRDTFLRIHGTNAPNTIGTRVSNGCARLVNDHVVDLYQRVPQGTRVVLYDMFS
ncbi:L,D-transpeptidase [Jannaschia sp. Os4]|uniref:L,D-transpeptidase n=1 Tax=Jannaschia sp. Os4 TaxID=2807617 RepID=UPI00193AB597|nr:L,D-transpeptidase [Jannaschia sp. Os4]MBM2576244.1 L,D-transpeptidase [Jannaschia sp. Os4]